jgi:S-methylmethionine-dependent homocysteine/selenocysteine methylase
MEHKMSTSSLLERLESGRPILMDGAINTELSNRGLVFNERDWLHVNLDRPEVVANIHTAYARAGAELHIANSFATAKHVAEYYGFPESFESLNRAAISVCRHAIDSAAPHDQWIAGSISTYAPGHDRSKLPSGSVLEANCRDQALILADAGCDMIALEMVADGATGASMLKGAAEAELPISIGLICERLEDGTLGMTRKYLGSESISECLKEILEVAPTEVPLIVTIMHSDVDDTTPALDEVRQAWAGKLGAYPHTGRPDGVGGWDMHEARSDSEFAQACVASIERGACFVGGCCGVGPHYISTLAEQISRR